jgi:hypothetical protein
MVNTALVCRKIIFAGVFDKVTTFVLETMPYEYAGKGYKCPY